KGKWVDNVWSWEWVWVRNLRGRVCKDFEELQELLQNVVIKFDCRDRWRWALKEDGNFTVRELTKLMEEKTLSIFSGGDSTIWNKWVPKKVNIFAWMALKGRLPVREELDKRGIDLDYLSCPSCGDMVESCSHCVEESKNNNNMSYTVEQLVSVNPYNPDILPDLQNYVNEQFEPERMSTQIVARILIKALMAMPAPDFSLCLFLIPERVQMDEQFKTLILLFDYLETAKFRQFWDEAAKARHILDLVPGFEQAIRNYAIHVLSLTYQKLPSSVLAETVPRLSCVAHALSLTIVSSLV
ncbi:eukaryotic translation initiation factor 3 subunit K, partial [Tanacetum coccineum]